jgi:trans-aconitate 2-methyltransferase
VRTIVPTWNPGQYLKFAEERTRPCRDLAAAVSISQPKRIIDLGCGPGNSTEILIERWPAAQITGLDSSAKMIETARESHPDLDWQVGDISDWASGTGQQFDLVFSNAALQWVGDHARIYHQLFDRVAAGGALAAQMPGNFDGPAHRLMREVAKSAEWLSKFSSGSVREWHVHDLPFYYDVLAPLAVRVDLWETDYIHVFPSAENIVEWYKGTGLRPFLEILKTESDREQFMSDYLDRLKTVYKPQPNGNVLFPFRRLFIIAYKE